MNNAFRIVAVAIFTGMAYGVGYYKGRVVERQESRK